MARSTTKIYVGNLPPDVKTRDVENLFSKYGPIAEIDLKSRRGPPFAFIEFEDELRGGFGRGGGGPSRRSDFRVVVTGLPPTGSWQDLKDHMREAGDVGYADVFRDGTGVVEFLRYEDMKYAVRKLDDSKFRSHEFFRVNPLTSAFVKSVRTDLDPVLVPGHTVLREDLVRMTLVHVRLAQGVETLELGH
ncbi:hypothetical protein X801_08122, partial [Opisthorchis viverrini]